MPRSSRQVIRLQRQTNQLLRDRSSGAAELATRAAELLALAEELELTEGRIERLRNRIVGAHPAMGSVWNAVHAADPSAFARDHHKRAKTLMRRARRQLPRGARVLTLSYSSTIVDLLGRKDYDVLVAESRPGGEGKRTARSLQHAGARATVVPDAALLAAARQSDFAVVGADAVTPSHVVNKMGTYQLALACRECGIPVYVIADSSKLVPDDWPLPEEGPDQIFEATPRHVFTSVICDAP